VSQLLIQLHTSPLASQTAKLRIQVSQIMAAESKASMLRPPQIEQLIRHINLIIMLTILNDMDFQLAEHPKFGEIQPQPEQKEVNDHPILSMRTHPTS